MEYTQNTFDSVPTTQNITVTNTSVTLTDLEEYVVYFIRVRAYTNIGSGSYSDPVNETTLQDSKYSSICSRKVYICCFLLAPASPPSDPTATVESSTSITVSWSEVPAIDQNGIIIEYEVEYTQNTFDSVPTTQNITVTNTSVTLTDLEEYVVYFIRVRAYTNIGSGPYSDPVNETTLQDSKYSYICSRIFIFVAFY